MVPFILITIFVTAIEIVLVYLFYKTWKSGLVVFTILAGAVIFSAFFIYLMPGSLMKADYRIIKESTDFSLTSNKKSALASYYPFAGDVFNCEFLIRDEVVDGYHELVIHAILKIDPDEITHWTTDLVQQETIPVIPDWSQTMIKNRTFWTVHSTPIRYDAPINNQVQDKFLETFLIVYGDEGIVILSSTTSEF